MLRLLRNSSPFPFILAGNRGIIQLNYKVSLIFRNARKRWMVLLEMCTWVLNNLIMIGLKRVSVDLRLDGRRCPSRQTRGPVVGAGRAPRDGREGPWSRRDLQWCLCTDCDGWLWVLCGFASWERWVRTLGELSKHTRVAEPEEAPTVWFKSVCFQTKPNAASLFEDLDSQRVCMKVSWKGGKSLSETGVWKKPSSC